MKVIDLLNKIANGEEVIAKHKIFDLEFFNSKDFHIGYKEGIDKFTLGDIVRVLNDEVEIIEEDKGIRPICPFDDLDIEEEKKIPKKIPLTYADNRSKEEVYEYLRCSINEIIDFIEENK